MAIEIGDEFREFAERAAIEAGIGEFIDLHKVSFGDYANPNRKSAGRRERVATILPVYASGNVTRKRSGDSLNTDEVLEVTIYGHSIYPIVPAKEDELAFNPPAFPQWKIIEVDTSRTGATHACICKRIGNP